MSILMKVANYLNILPRGDNPFRSIILTYYQREIILSDVVHGQLNCN
jgi:hypothetical protein